MLTTKSTKDTTVKPRIFFYSSFFVPFVPFVLINVLVSN